MSPTAQQWPGGMSRRHLIRLGLALAGAGEAAACSSGPGSTGVQGTRSGTPTPRRTPTAQRLTVASSGAPSGKQPRRASDSSPTPQQLAGQRIIYSYPGLTVSGALLERVAAGEAAGVIFFGRNIASRAQISETVAQLREAQRESPSGDPLLLMTDQEGGLIRRLPGDPVLSQQQIGQDGDPLAAATAAGTAAGRNLASVGMNLNLAPVLDVTRSPDGFIALNQRSYGGGAAIDATLGGAFIAAQQASGVAAAAKHFPGLGAAASWQNTDEVPVTLDVPADELRAVDELPYRSAISAGVKMVMVSWATYPALDARRPAGLSPLVVRQELRGRLGYSGVTITDALEAGALGPFGSAGERAVAAAAAGADLILCSSGDVAQGEDAAAALLAAFREGRLDAGDFNAGFERISALRRSLR